MTFLNPLVLFGAIAAAIPVILHLLNLRKLRTIEFSTLKFLKELQQTKIRRLKMRQILLLIIRTLLVVFIVLAFARPALKGTFLGKIGGNAHSSIVLIVDDSFSMSGSDEEGDLLKQEKDRINKLIDLLNDGDEIFLIRLSDLPDATINPAMHDFRALRTMINDLQISPIRKPMNDALRLAAKLLSSSKNANKEVYVMSDRQQSLFAAEVANAQAPSTGMFEPTVRFFMVNTGSGEIVNTSIDSVEVRTKIIEKDKPVTIYASFRNFSPAVVQNNVVSVFLEGVRVAQNSVHIEPWGSTSLEFTVIPKKSGYIKGFLELEHDAIEQDNRRYFTMYVPEKISIAFVSDSPEDMRMPIVAIGSATTSDSSSLFDIKRMNQKDAQFLDFEKTDVLALSLSETMSQSFTDRLKGFVERGGGLILFPSSNFQPGDVSKKLLSSLSIAPIEAVQGSQTEKSSLTFNKVDFDHPLFSTVFESENKGKSSKLSVESPSIYKTLRRRAGANASPVISLGDGSAFLSEHRIGKGKILFYSVSPTLSWSDFPVKGIFVPLLYRSVMYISSKGKTNFSFLAGDEPVIALANVPIGQRGLLKLISPDGIEELISTEEKSQSQGTSNNEVTIGLKKLTNTGFYSIMSQNTPITYLAVNTDSKESDCRKIQNEDLERFWKYFGIESSSIRELNKTEKIQAQVTESRFGVELWKHCIIIAFLLALLEMFIARDSRKEMQTLATSPA